MVKIFAVIICVNFLSALTLFAGQIPEEKKTAPEKKYLLILADWGSNSIPSDVLSALEKNPNFKITIAWKSAFKLPDQLKNLEKAKEAEIALSFVEEPLMPLVYDTEISTPAVIKFSWQEDVWNMMFRANEEFRVNTQVREKACICAPVCFQES
jgi:hypothetical protein